MSTNTKQHRNDFRQADAIRFGKVAEMRAKIQAGTLDMEHRLDVALDRMIDAVERERESKILQGDGFDWIEDAR